LIISAIIESGDLIVTSTMMQKGFVPVRKTSGLSEKNMNGAPPGGSRGIASRWIHFDIMIHEHGGTRYETTETFQHCIPTQWTNPCEIYL
jgi:hypothetical protein